MFLREGSRHIAIIQYRGDFLPKNNAYACLLGAALKIIFPWKDQLLRGVFRAL